MYASWRFRSDHASDSKRYHQRYSGRGGEKRSVTVKCTQKDFYVDVRIEDTGCGISPVQIGKIFDPYFTTKQGKSGTGLGLYITKKVVEDHNGSIKVDSTPDVGTTFTIRLPLLNN